MGCGRRMRGRPSPSVVDRGLLFKRIRELEHIVDIYDAGAMVDRLRDLYWDYANKKLQPFTHCVQQALERRQHQRRRLQAKHGGRDWGGDAGDEDEVIEEDAAPSSRGLKRPRGTPPPAPVSPARSSTPASSTSSSSSSSAESDGEDAVYKAKVQPEFDLVKSALRESYSKARQQPAGGGRGKAETDVQEENAMDGKLRRTAVLVGRTAVASPVAATPGRVWGGEGSAPVVGEGREGPRFKDFGGIKAVLEELLMEVVVPLYHPHLPRMLGVKPMAGILLHGPPGCGKTKLAHAIANETGVPFYKISATEVISGVSGASEENIRELFKKAYRTAPSIVFIDEIDAIGSKRENLQREMERRIVTQLMTCMDESHQALGMADADSDTESSDRKPGYVLVIGATNRPDAVDAALRRPGRFDRELFLGVPDENARREILSVLTEKLKLNGALDLSKIARATPGFVGADLAALVNKAGNLAMRRIIDERKSELSRSGCEDQDVEWWRRSWAPDEMDKLSISMFDFEEAAKIVQPSSRREGFSSIPNVKWEDVGGLDSLRKEFDRYVVQRVKTPEKYDEFGVTLEAGFLLYGPPGCGKTLIAKAVANEAAANFIHIKGPELLNKYVGESELAVRTIFSRARTCSPCILFFDEIDALTTRRGKDGESVVERLLLQLLIELDGADQRRSVFVIGATNRPEAVDPAVLRPGRLGKVMYVPLPSADERVLILKAVARRKPLATDVDLDLIGRKEECENFSGADLAALVNEAAMAALEEKQRSIDHDIGPSVIKTLHFEQALMKVSPSVSEKRRKYYEAMSQNLRAA